MGNDQPFGFVDSLIQNEHCTELTILDRNHDLLKFIHEPEDAVRLKVNSYLDSLFSGLNCSETPLGVDDFLINEQIKIFPNPVSTVLSIDNKTVYDIKRIIIYNLTGEKVASFSQTQISVLSLPASFYFLQIELNNNKKLIKKMVKI